MWFKGCAAGLLWLSAASCAWAGGPKRVLILEPYGREIAPFSTLAATFRETLARELGEPVDFHDVSLEMARAAQPESQAAVVEFLQRILETEAADLVVTIGGPAAQFAVTHCRDLLGDRPVLMVGGDRRLLPAGFPCTNTTLITQHVVLEGMVEDILQVSPSTKHIAVVFGNTALERFWAGECRREFQVFTNRVEFIWLDGLSLEHVEARCAALPPGSFILYSLFIVDATGIPFEHNQALRRLRETANAPIFAFFASQLGLGGIGGRLYDDHEIGLQGAFIAARILRGEHPGAIPPLFLGAKAPVFDWRELNRWGIPESALPPGSTVVYRPPALWQTHRWQLLTAGGIMVALAAGLAALLAERGRRREAEDSMRALSGRLIQAQEEERARLARELHDDITQRLARLAIDTGLAERQGIGQQGSGKMRGVREELVRLSEDVHGLSYRLHPSLLKDLGLAEALKAECERVSRGGTCPATITIRDVPGPVPNDAALCLFRVAQESLSNAARHARARSVEVALQGLDGGLQLTVRDDGIGFDPALPRDRAGLGLASMRERVRLLGGRLEIASTPGKGTAITAWLPQKNTTI